MNLHIAQPYLPCSFLVIFTFEWRQTTKQATISSKLLFQEAFSGFLLPFSLPKYHLVTIYQNSDGKSNISFIVYSVKWYLTTYYWSEYYVTIIYFLSILSSILQIVIDMLPPIKKMGNKGICTMFLDLALLTALYGFKCHHPFNDYSFTTLVSRWRCFLSPTLCGLGGFFLPFCIFHLSMKSMFLLQNRNLYELICLTLFFWLSHLNGVKQQSKTYLWFLLPDSVFYFLESWRPWKLRKSTAKLALSVPSLLFIGASREFIFLIVAVLFKLRLEGFFFLLVAVVVKDQSLEAFSQFFSSNIATTEKFLINCTPMVPSLGFIHFIPY